MQDKPPRDSAGKAPDGDLPPQVSRAIAEAMRDQKKRQERLRHVQEFLTSPAFFDIKDQPLAAASPGEDLAERRADLAYRIRVMESILSVLMDEMDLIDRILADQKRSASAPPPDPAEPAPPEAKAPTAPDQP